MKPGSDASASPGRHGSCRRAALPTVSRDQPSSWRVGVRARRPDRWSSPARQRTEPEPPRWPSVAAGSGRVCPAHRVRQRRKLVAGASGGPTARDGRARGARRGPGAPRGPDAHREPRPRIARRPRRPDRGLLGDSVAPSADARDADRDGPADVWARPARPHVHVRALNRDRTTLRVAACMASREPGSARSAEGRDENRRPGPPPSPSGSRRGRDRAGVGAARGRGPDTAQFPGAAPGATRFRVR